MPKLSAVRFNEKTAGNAKPRSNPYELRDAGYKGLILRVQPSGSKRFILEVERGKRVMLGDPGILTLGEWKSKATKILAAHESGEDVATKKKASNPLETFVKGDYRDWALQHQKDGEANVRRVLKACEPLMKRRMNMLGHLHIERWKSDRLRAGIAASTLNRDMQGLKSVLNRAVAWGVLPASPTAGVKRVRAEVDHRVRYLEPDERTRLMAALKARDQQRRKARDSGNVFRLARGREPLDVFTGVYTDYLHLWCC